MWGAILLHKVSKLPVFTAYAIGNFVDMWLYG